MKKAHLSPVTSMAVSLSLTFGILVSFEVKAGALTLILAGMTVVLVCSRLANVVYEMFEMLLEKLPSITITFDLRTKENLALKERIAPDTGNLPSPGGCCEERGHKERL